MCCGNSVQNLMIWLFFFSSSSAQTGQGAEGEAVRLPGCHLRGVCHWSHQSSSSSDVSVSLVASHSHIMCCSLPTRGVQGPSGGLPLWWAGGHQKFDYVKSTTRVFTAVLKSLWICSAALIIRSELDFHASNGTRSPFFTSLNSVMKHVTWGNR